MSADITGKIVDVKIEEAVEDYAIARWFKIIMNEKCIIKV